MLPGPSQQFWGFPRVGQRVTSPSKLPMVTGSGLKPCRALGFGWKCPVLTQGIGCSRIIPEPKARAHPGLPTARERADTGDCPGPGISRMDPRPAWILPWAASNPAGSPLTRLLAFFPGYCSRIGGFPWAGTVPWPGTEAAAPSRGLCLALRAGNQPEFPRKVGFLLLRLPLPQCRVFISAPDMEILWKSANFYQIPPRRRVGFL